VFQAVGMVKDVDKETGKFREPEPPPLSDDDFPMDEDTQDDETLVETIDAPPEGEPSEAMKEKLAPALELAKELKEEQVEF